MNLCKWVTNSSDLRDKWAECAMEHTTETDICGNILKVLGLVWRPESLIHSQLWWNGPTSLLSADEAEIIDENYIL